MTYHDWLAVVNRQMLVGLETEAAHNWPAVQLAISELAKLMPIPRRAHAAAIACDVTRIIFIPITVDLIE